MALAAFLASSAPGQAPNESVPPPQVAEPPLAKNQIRIRANEVIVPVTVTDRNSELVFDLSQKDFQVFDNGVEQTIDHWDLGGDPLAVALVLETSSHIQAMMPVIHSMGSEWWEQATSDQVCKTLPAHFDARACRSNGTPWPRCPDSQNLAHHARHKRN